MLIQWIDQEDHRPVSVHQRVAMCGQLQADIHRAGRVKDRLGSKPLVTRAVIDLKYPVTYVVEKTESGVGILLEPRVMVDPKIHLGRYFLHYSREGAR